MAVMGKGVTYEIDDDNDLVIVINLDEDFGPSKSGKSINVATSNGNRKIGNTHFVLGLNCYYSPDDVPKAVTKATAKKRKPKK